MIQLAPLTIMSSLDHSPVLHQGVTQIFALAATSMNQVAGPSGQTMDQQAALLMVRPQDTEGNCFCSLYVRYHYSHVQL